MKTGTSTYNLRLSELPISVVYKHSDGLKLTRATIGVSGLLNRAQKVRVGHLPLKDRLRVHKTRMSRKPAVKEVLEEARDQAKSGGPPGWDQRLHSAPAPPIQRL